MRHLLFALAIIITFPFSSSAEIAGIAKNTEQTPAPLKIGKKVPPFTATDSQGNIVSLDELAGKIVVMEWKNHQCPFVRKHYGTDNMQKLQSFAKEHEIVWISVISSAPGKQGYVTAEEANSIAKEENSTAAHIILDTTGVLGRVYHARTTPHMYVINKDSTLAYMGAIDSIPSADPDDIEKAENYVMAAMTSLLKGETPATSVSSAYGCSVKYDY